MNEQLNAPTLMVGVLFPRLSIISVRLPRLSQGKQVNFFGNGLFSLFLRVFPAAFDGDFA